jgi:transformation/transcription domain-associated protein
LPKLLKKGMTSEDASIHESLFPVLHRILQIYPLPKEDEENSSPVAELHAFIHNTISERLRNLSTSVRGSLLMLKSIVQTSPERMEYFGPGLMKLLSKLTKEHLLQPASTAAGHESLLRMLITTLDVCFMSTSHLGEQRRAFLTTLNSLVEKSSSETLSQYLLDQASSWVFDSKELHPSMREKAALLNRMVTFERFGDEFLTRYLEVIYAIYTDNSFRRSDLTSRLDNAFLMGCINSAGPLRDQFIDLMDLHTPRSIGNRLVYITTANWEQLSPRHWIPVALDLLLAAVSSGMFRNRPHSNDMNY